MTYREQVVQISARATSFTAVCVECADLDNGEGYLGATFGGRLDDDLDEGVFLCRSGHAIRIVREAPPADAAAVA